MHSIPFAKLAFAHQAPKYPWAEAVIPRVAFIQCGVRVSVMNIGACYEYPEREPDDTASLTAFYETKGRIVEEHERAFDHFMENIPSYEEKALGVLRPMADDIIREAMEFLKLPAYNEFTRGLPEMITKFRLDSPEGVMNQVSWQGISIYDHGLDECGLITLDFNCGWDEEHGVSILMHRAQTIAASGLADFSNREQHLLAHAKCLQKYGDDYDIKL